MNIFSSGHKVSTRAIITVLIVAMIAMPLFLKPRTASAQAGMASNALAVPISTGFDYNITMQHLKDFVLDRLATLLAKQILHQMTVSVVNWINSGFQGSPSFLTDPEGFFLDAADQVTGAFLATEGPLSRLCSPFSVDIRLSLALNQASLLNQRYECTLGRIIDNVSNIDKTPIYVNGQNINQASMEGFLGGDFSQGGWPAFIALTTEPQNNPYGGFLQAQSDLYTRISQNENAIHADLQIGSGFLSFPNCKDFVTFDPSDPDQYNEVESQLSGATGMKRIENSDGTVTYQTCKTETPGSVIENTLTTQLGSPVRELELANNINAIVNALVSQMVTRMLTGGLHTLSDSSSGSGSYMQSILNDSQSSAYAQQALNNLQNQIGPAMDTVRTYKALYDQAVTLVSDSKNRYISARECLNGKLSGGGGAFLMSAGDIQRAINEIDQKLSQSVNPLFDSLTKSQTASNVEMTKLQEMSDAISGTGSVSNVNEQAEKYSEFVENGGLNVYSKLDAAQVDLENAKEQSAVWNVDAIRYQSRCGNY